MHVRLCSIFQIGRASSLFVSYFYIFGLLRAYPAYLVVFFSFHFLPARSPPDKKVRKLCHMTLKTLKGEVWSEQFFFGGSCGGRYVVPFLRRYREIAGVSSTVRRMAIPSSAGSSGANICG